MKKYLMIVCMMLVSTAMFAQKGTAFVGAQFSYGVHKDYSQAGIGAKVQYEVVDNLRGEASGNYFFKKDGVSVIDVNLNAHYMIHATEALTVYPLAGVALVIANYSVLSNTSDIGFNVGAGAEYPLSDAIKINAELKYQVVKDWNRFVPSLGIAFRL